ncbi:ribonuclease R [Mycoplasmopsis felifaucium]|uniref:Ribonuclease R n=1 Tax=Mycoplasmopsis felifaucium TaxID=35768 RepID=A0ABZ2RQ87_9BACT
MIDPKQLLKIIQNNPNISFINIAKKMNIKYNQNRQLTDLLIDFIDKNLIVNNRKNSTYIALEKLKTVIGTMKFASEGKFAFVDCDIENITEEKESYFVPNAYFADAMNNDIVKISVYKYYDSKDERTFGMVEQIIERNTTKIVGVLDNINNYLTFKPMEKCYKSMQFKVINSIEEARILDIVVAEIVEFKNSYKGINIIKKITNVNDPMAYVKSLEVSRNVPEDFPQEVYDYVNANIPDDISKEDISKRLDLRKELIVTIDGVDTKDFDDAISIKKNGDGTFELGVHIADVAYYVKENTVLDDEALKRGTSIYLLDSVIPMLPFKLSNGICSLNPNVDRMTISCISTIDKNGKTLKTKVCPSVIRSKYRLTYDRVNEFYKEKRLFEVDELNELISNAFELSTIIRKFKMQEGYIDFEIEEPNIVLDSEGRVVDIVVKPSGESEMMIEDFMVRANEEVAKYLTKKKIPMLYRIHEIPNEERLDYFLNVLKLLNIKVNIDRNNITPLSFQKIVQEINTQQKDEFLKMLFLRTMQKAVYSPNNVGHFGLASDCYCHFTSPIRRYPDVIVHRALWNFVFNDASSSKINHFGDQLERIASMTSTSEQNAVQLERDANDLKFAEYYKSKINSEFEGQIFSITKFGIFVQFANKTVAMAHLSNIANGDFQPNDAMTELFNEHNPKEKYKLGEFVRVVITGADESTGKVDCVLAKYYLNYINKLKQEISQKNNIKKKHD